MEKKIFTESPYIIPITDEEIKNFIRETPRSPGVYKFLDTFKNPLYNYFPNLEHILFSLFETLKDITLFIKDLF